jgi:hypothetical protein
VLAVVGAILLAHACYGAAGADSTSATAASGSWWANHFQNPSSTTSPTYTPANGVGANITWTAGKDTADEKSGGPTTKKEPKFPQPLPTAPAGTTSNATFTGLTLSVGPGKFGSTATSTGTGSSTITRGNIYDGYSATWTVTATGTKGAGGSYYAYMNGADPWPITAADLAGLGSQYDVWIPFAILGGSSIGSGPNFDSSIGYDVDYTTASGTSQLLQIGISGSQVTVTGSAAAGILGLYEISGLDAVPDFTTPITQAQLQAILMADLTGGALSSPVDIGVSLGDIPVPTVDLGDGSVAQISEDAWASQAATPEPSTFALLGLGILGLLACEWRRKVNSGCLR